MMYNISVAEKRVLNKEKQFLEVVFFCLCMRQQGPVHIVLPTVYAVTF